MAHTNAEQLRELIAANGAALVLYARQWCRAPDDALQEALIELLQQDPAPNNPVGWLYTTVRRRAMNQARAENRRSRHHQLASRQRESWFVTKDTALGEVADLERSLEQLPQLERQIVVARIWGELSFGQIAELVDRSTSAVHRRYQWALLKLGKMICKERLENHFNG